jgi:hypothetical protein
MDMSINNYDNWISEKSWMWTDTGKLGMIGIMTAVYVLVGIVLGDGSSRSFVGTGCPYNR